MRFAVFFPLSFFFIRSDGPGLGLCHHSTTKGFVTLQLSDRELLSDRRVQAIETFVQRVRWIFFVRPPLALLCSLRDIRPIVNPPFGPLLNLNTYHVKASSPKKQNGEHRFASLTGVRRNLTSLYPYMLVLRYEFNERSSRSVAAYRPLCPVLEIMNGGAAAVHVANKPAVPRSDYFEVDFAPVHLESPR